ncbi:PTS sugar transporter subunit IIB [Effusibacillus consociatus]|uniref:PTS sugar transporter subunit IIB n=1 Tax=Effusibacillus consociatus TaxID=1117041 RepID=A0ABV9Q244_9BACL
MARKQIALVCSFGLSTSLLVQAMERSAIDKAADVEISAIGTSELAEKAESVDVFLLAPQVRYMLPTVAKYGKPVGVVDGLVYATADGSKVLEQALRLGAEEEIK